MINEIYRNLLSTLLSKNIRSQPRGMDTVERLMMTTTIDMCEPIITLPGRDLDYKFMAAEAYWILSGDRRLNHSRLEHNLLKYSDDTRTMRGAYGPPFMQQVEYVKDVLIDDPMSRQGVMTLWERNPRPSRDIPCTVAIQWIIRDAKLNCHVFMRSSDAWLGWPYDIFAFSMMSLYLRASLWLSAPMATPIDLGYLCLVAGSQHLYERNIEAASLLTRCSVGEDNLTISSHKFLYPDDIMCALDATRNAINSLECMKKMLC